MKNISLSDLQNQQPNLLLKAVIPTQHKKKEKAKFKN